MTGNPVLFSVEDFPSSKRYSTSLNKGLMLGILPTHKDSPAIEQCVACHPGHILTIAPDGSGKTECQVLSNLLTWPGPALVLDLKGELFAKTHKWRSKDGRRVLCFDPSNPKKSARFNPLTFIRDNPETLKSDVEILADALLYRTPADVPWDIVTSNLLQATLIYYCLETPPERRSMAAVSNLFLEQGFLTRLCARLADQKLPDIMSRHVLQIIKMNSDPRDAMLKFLDKELSCWRGPVEEITTGMSNWEPQQLRNQTDILTVYLSLSSGDLEHYAPIFRLILETHFRHFVTTKASPGHKAPVIFFLDGFAELREMKTLASDILYLGKGAGHLFWLFTKGEDQLAEYGDVDLFSKNFPFRCYMKPDKKTAEKISGQIGLDGGGTPILSAERITSPEFQDKIIVLTDDEKPAVLEKFWTSKFPEMQQRMTGPYD